MSFVTAPPLVILEFSDLSMEIDHSFGMKLSNEMHQYDLANVVYYRDIDEHFVSNIVSADKQLWSYDGLNTSPQLVHSGSFLNCPQLTTC